MAMAAFEMLAERALNEKGPAAAEALNLIKDGKFETHGKKELLRSAVRVARQAATTDQLCEKTSPFALLFRTLCAHRQFKFQSITFLCGGDGDASFEELRMHEAVVESGGGTLTGTATEFDLVVRHIIWCLVGPRSQAWFRMAHTPEGLLGSDADLTLVKRITEVQIRAKEDLIMALSRHCSEEVVRKAIADLHVGGDAVQTCPYIEIQVQKTKRKVKELESPFVMCAMATPPGFTCRRRLVGHAQLMRAQNRLPSGFAAAMAVCDHEKEFILLVRQHIKAAVFVIAKDLILMDPDPSRSSTDLYMNPGHE